MLWIEQYLNHWQYQNKEKKLPPKNRSGNNKKPRKDENPQWARPARTLAFWAIILMVSIWVTMTVSHEERQVRTVTYSQFQELLQQKRIRSIDIKGAKLDAELVEPLQIDPKDRTNYVRVNLPEKPNYAVIDEWQKIYGDANGLTVTFKDESQEWWNYLLSLLPWVILGSFWLFLLRRMQGVGSKGIFSFGKSRAKMLTENRPKITFDDVAGADEAKQELREIIEFLRDPERFQRLGGKIPKGALLLGPPGTGKTLLAKAVAGEAGVPFFSMSGADFVEMFVGVGASRVRDLFEQGKKNAPCIIFIDEVDAVGRHRGAGLGGGHDEREQTLNQLLVEMDGFDSNEGVILIAATNRPDVLDSALLRPGRFDRQIVVDRPDVRGREGILKVHTKKIPISKDVNLNVLAKGTPGFSGADIASMVNEAALLAARNNKDRVSMRDLEEAKDKVLMGTERRSMLISENEKRITAYHEAGHALVAKFTPGADPVHKVTIIPRGRALGLTTTLPIDEKHNYSRNYCESLLAHLMGGREAEKLVFKELTTGAGNDIERATELARKMVCEWGMSDLMGPLAFGKKEEEIFLGREIAQHRDYSERTAQMIDEEVKRIVLEATQRAAGIIKQNEDKLHAMANALLEREILDGDEIDAILSGELLPPIENGKNGRPAGVSEKSVAA
jgi:cell division protease FtsH